MESNKWETEEKEINMTQAEQDRISERWLRITRAIKNAVEQAEDRKVAQYYVIKYNSSYRRNRLL